MSIDAMKKVFKAEFAQLHAIHEHVKKTLSKYYVDEALMFKAMVVSEEITTNISQYGYSENAGTDHFLEIDIRIVDKNRIVMEFVDYGIPFNLSAYRKPEGSPEIELGGLGIMLVKKLAHKLEYRRENNRNITTATLKGE